MANSLMELYGGGMTGPSNNYQLGGGTPEYALGGQIASSRRNREYSGEMRGLREKAERAASRKKKSGFWGSVGSLAGGALGSLLGPAGAAVGAGLGRRFGEGATYKETDYGEGKYAQETRGNLSQAEDDYKKGMSERALVSGLQAAIMPGVYKKAGSWLKGLGGTEELASAAQVADIAGAAPEFAAGFGTAPVHDGMTARGLGLSGPPTLGTTPSMSMKGLGEFAPSMTGNLMPTAVGSQASMLGDQALSVLADTQLGDFSKLNLPSQYASNNQYRDLGGFGPFMRGGGGIPMMPMGGLVNPQASPIGMQQRTPNTATRAGMPAPTTGSSTDYTPDLSNTDFSALEGFQVFGDDNPVFGKDTDLSGLPIAGMPPSPEQKPFDPSANYGTAIGSQSALTQMGMGDVANDPRLQQYLKDLPQFSQGYRQQFGDIQTGGRQSLAQMYSAQRNTGGGFSGSGAGKQAFGQQYAGLMGDQSRQRRGVVEGFQSDLLSGISDIERKGEFEFGVGTGVDPIVEYMQNNPNLTREEAEAQYDSENIKYYDQQYG